MFATSESIDERTVLKRAVSCLLGARLSLKTALDSRDLFNLLSTLKNSVDKSVCANVDCIRYESEMKNAYKIV